jgi:hypothetical protein
MASTEFARTVALLAVEALEMSRMKAGRSGCGDGECGTSSTVLSEAVETCALALGEGLDEAGAERGMGGEYIRRGCGEKYDVCICDNRFAPRASGTEGASERGVQSFSSTSNAPLTRSPWL